MSSAGKPFGGVISPDAKGDLAEARARPRTRARWAAEKHSADCHTRRMGVERYHERRLSN